MIRPKISLNNDSLDYIKTFAAQNERHLNEFLAELIILGWQQKVGIGMPTITDN